MQFLIDRDSKKVEEITIKESFDQDLRTAFVV